MTGMKIILAVVPDAEGGLATLETAFVAGRDLNCHVRVLHVRPDPTNSLPLVGEAMSGAMIDEMITVCETEGSARATKVRSLFDQVVNRYSIPLVDEPPGPAEMSASYSEDVGQEDEMTVLRGRMTDLIVCGRPLAGGDDPSLQATLNAALMESGRPVLIAPPAPINGLDQTVMIAWNGSSEAARSVSAAMHFLLRAKRVVISVAADADGEETSAEELVTHLAWHGVDAEINKLDVKTAADVGPALLQSCKDVDARLLVMGAYTHSRLRQLILGGVTRYMLDNAPIPVLLAH